MICNYFFKSLIKYRFTLKPAQDNTNGMKINGTWTGILGELATGVGTHVMTYESQMNL